MRFARSLAAATFVVAVVAAIAADGDAADAPSGDAGDSRDASAPASAASAGLAASPAVVAPASGRGATPGEDRSGGYVGSAACRPCHEAATSAWQGSHHDLAMQVAGSDSVLGDFHDTTFDAHGVTTTFSTRDGRYFVRTDGPAGEPADYEVKYAFGVTPLQQYLVEFPGGRLQALPVAWDSRPKEQGGQRWFHLTPGEKLAAGDPLHWTGLYQNWNLQCAECHSTNLRKNWNPETGTYATTWAEIDVACESCHGAGAEHVAWAKDAKPPYAAADAKGLRVLLRRATTWAFPTPDARFAQPSPVAHAATAGTTAGTTDAAIAAAARETEAAVCAPCHARRSTLSDDVAPGAPLADGYRLAFLTGPLYFADGQQRDEVYTWGSFLQSKMHARGVTCGDCHDPHTLKLRSPGNAVCATCHNASAFDTKAHHFHEPGTKGSQCVDCHMTARDYMVIDPRRDHSMRVPRPDVSAKLGSPDACTGCHVGRTPAWAADAMDGWYAGKWRERPEHGTTLHLPATDGARSVPPLLALASDRERPAIVRATAATLAGPFVRPEIQRLLPAERVRALLVDEDPLVRLAAIDLAESLPTGERTAAVAPLVADPRLAVRVAAVRSLANVNDERLAPELREPRAKARREYLDAARGESDWPATLVALGDFALREGRMEDAVASYERALALDPAFAPAYVNLADARRLERRDAEGEALLRRGLGKIPEDPGLHHALGLLLVRRGEKPAALAELAEAVRLAPDDARFAYVYAVALQSTGREDEALAVLVTAERKNPFDFDLLTGLVSMYIEAGRTEDSLPYARQLVELLPDDEGLRSMIREIERRTAR